MKDLLRFADLSVGDLDHLLDLSQRIHDNPHRHTGLLEGETVVTYFAKPSTRTRLSFGSAISHLGGLPEVVGPNDLQLGRGETIEDTARVVSRYAKAFVIRTYSDDDVRRFAAAATIPVINALTDLHHPCQALADLLTLRQHFGVLTGMRLAYLGDGNNVAHSLLEACALSGIDIVVATPPGYELDPDVVRTAFDLGETSGSIVLTTHDPLFAVAGADAVYTDVWVSMNDSDAEKAARVGAFTPYQVNAAVMAEASPDAVFLHCLPAHRGEEVSASVIDGSQSLILDEAENRMHTAQALLVSLILGKLTGAARALEAGSAVMLAVVALGGNALLRRGEPLDAAVQRANMKVAAEAIAEMTGDHRLVITHGNGPQVGLLALQNEAYGAVDPYPLDVLGAETEGMVGYLLEQELGRHLDGGRLVTLLTQVVVDPADPAFHDPTKFVGPAYDDERDARFVAHERGWVVKPDGDYWRRVVPSPEPKAIVEIATIRLLVGHGVTVICTGGGGIPVMADTAGGLRGVEAVIDKDLSAALLAEELDADALVLLTDVDAVYAEWRTPDERAIRETTPAELRALDLPAGSMGPKVEAICRFVERGGQIGAIGSLGDAADILRGHAGTIVRGPTS